MSLHPSRAQLFELIARRVGPLIILVDPHYLASCRQSATSLLVQFLSSAHLARVVCLNNLQELMIQHEQKGFFCIDPS